jgi:hypothetical protein
MHQAGANTSDGRGLDRSQDGIAEQADADAATLVPVVHGEATEYHHRHGFRHVASDLAWGVFMRDRARADGVIADHALRLADDVRSRRSAHFDRQGSLLEPVIEHRDAGIECGDIMRGAEVRRRRDEWRAAAHRSHGGREVPLEMGIAPQRVGADERRAVHQRE